MTTQISKTDTHSDSFLSDAYKSNTFDSLLNRCFRICSNWSILHLQSTLLTLSGRGPLSYRNQSIDLQSKSMDWFLYDNGLRLERVKVLKSTFHISLIVFTLYDSFPVTLYGSNLTQNN